MAKNSAEISKIKASNEAYYKALSARDMRAMEKVWTCAADNILIAPPSNPRVHLGWSAIKRNWLEQIPINPSHSQRGRRSLGIRRL
jgi:ketosteroid isomerase-like protein